jgi:8-oxo-dGTP diphosphatase
MGIMGDALPSNFQSLSPDEVRHHKGKSFPGITTVFLCHDGTGSFFMAKRSAKCRDEQGRWDIGGGGLKMGQRAVNNALREIKEEYGAKVEPDTFDHSGWFTLDTLPSPLHSQLELEYFDKYRNRLKQFGIT